MSERGWIAPRIQKKDLDGPLFADWRLRAWNHFYADAEYTTGELVAAGREMAMRYGASKGTFERWIDEMEDAGYLRRQRVGTGPRSGRLLVIAEIADRESGRGKRSGKAGAKGGALFGANKTSNGADTHGVGGAKNGAIDGANVGQSLGHVLSKEDYQEVTTVPSEPCATGDADLFGEPAPERSPAAPSEPEPEKPSAVAQRVLAVFHDLSKARGGNGVSPAVWGAQQKITETALRTIQSEQGATDALRWGMGEEYWRQRLRAHQMKVLVDVWSAWVEETGCNHGRNGNGRNGTGGAGGETGGGQGAGGGEIVLNNGRWERR